jgi:hypothetical protein
MRLEPTINRLSVGYAACSKTTHFTVDTNVNKFSMTTHLIQGEWVAAGGHIILPFVGDGEGGGYIWLTFQIRFLTSISLSNTMANGGYSVQFYSLYDHLQL